MAREHYEINGKTVLITGGASGIGAETAKQLAARGARLALVDVSQEQLDRQVAAIGGETIGIEADVTDNFAIERAVGATIERFGGIDVVLAGAGIVRIGTVASGDPRDFERVIEVNLLGVWRTVRAALPHVVERQGYVIPIASLAAALWTPLMASYNMAKAGVDAFATTLRQELYGTGTKVGCAYFAVIDTPMVDGAMAHPAIQFIRERSPGVLSRSTPVESAAGVIVRGIERRSKRVYAPAWVGPALYARGVLSPVVERMTRDQAAREAIDMAETTARARSSVNGSGH